MQHLYAWLRRRPTVADTGWALLVLGLGVLSEASAPEHRYSTASFLVVAPMLAGLMAVRRRFPDAALAGGLAVGLLQVAAGWEPNPTAIALLVLAYTAAAFGSRWASRTALAAGLAAGPLTLWRFSTADDPRMHQPGQIVLVSVLLSVPFVLCWALGRLTRVRRAYYAELEDRAARLERERDARAKVAVAAERARIARELHDVVAHNVSVMVVQADGAAYVMDASPGQAREALATIASTGRQALDEMRRLLGVLRSADPGEGEYVPQPGVEQLPDLLEQVRGAGLPVDFALEGSPCPLPRGVELTAYRIVQEALTNVRKHGGPDARAEVRIRFADGTVDVRVEDDGRGAVAELYEQGGADGQGHGLIGMRERVGMVGGSLDAGPRPGGGFRIRAVLPLRAATTA
ncbi:sensor histidine kinase [Streptacidiphilus sp. ASG 303]|uniref:sensor histidine kinase n=1 Tax=Streptacidiphilus sp. ASG 303 TaxID=2896847 RepID=UPI001E29010E|nr:sensor histidine kinase [Streptacidiphilus sp. ASG 303]MCD0482481.1 sensor histidine kinase [Streptacidiphilus sp. ASG 303]